MKYLKKRIGLGEASVNVGCRKKPVDKSYKLLTVVACVF